MGSIGDNTTGGWYGYRMSKSAVNAAGVSLARDLRGRGLLARIDAVVGDLPVEAFACCVGVSRVEQGEIVRLAGREIAARPRAKRITRSGKRFRATQQRDAAGGQAAEVDGVAAVGAADGDGDARLRRVAGLGVP
jgi:hypothetical protein